MGMGHFQVWIGNPYSYSGCGVVIDARHVVTCNHVVRHAVHESQLPGAYPSLYGGEENDLVGQRVLARSEEHKNEVELEVIGNQPLPADDPGAREFDDLCLLRLVSHDLGFRNHATFVLGDPAYGTPFTGQGITAIEGGDARFDTQLFSGIIKPRALFKYWNFTSEPEGHLQSKPRFSGAALQMPETSQIFGLLQGNLIQQVGYFIPAGNIFNYAKSLGVSPQGFDPSRPVFRSIFRPSKFNLTNDKLLICDRMDQVRQFDLAKGAFLENLFDAAGPQLFAIGIAGQKMDLPDLLQLRLGPNAVLSYRDFRRRKLQDEQEPAGSGKFPVLKIDLQYDTPDQDALTDFVLGKIAGASSPDAMFQVGLPDKAAIVAELQALDSPVLFTIFCPVRLCNTAMVEAWLECLTDIAATRDRHRPIIAIFIFKLGDELVDLSIFDRDDFTMLPLLNEIDAAHVGPWLATIMPGDDEGHDMILAHVREQSGGGPFRMRSLRDWLFADDNQQGTGT